MSKLDEKYIQYLNYCIENQIPKMLMFIKDPTVITELKNHIDEMNYTIELIGVTFPSNEVIYIRNSEDEIDEYIPEAADGDRVKENLSMAGIKLISGTLPFEGIVVPGESFNPYKIIEQSFNLIHKGLANTIQSVLVATDNGAISPSERIVSCNNSVAVDLHGTNTRFLFHPEKGLVINEIIK